MLNSAISLDMGDEVSKDKGCQDGWPFPAIAFTSVNNPQHSTHTHTHSKTLKLIPYPCPPSESPPHAFFELQSHSSISLYLCIALCGYHGGNQRLTASQSDAKSSHMLFIQFYLAIYYCWAIFSTCSNASPFTYILNRPRPRLCLMPTPSSHFGGINRLAVSIYEMCMFATCRFNKASGHQSPWN